MESESKPSGDGTGLLYFMLGVMVTLICVRFFGL